MTDSPPIASDNPPDGDARLHRAAINLDALRTKVRRDARFAIVTAAVVLAAVIGTLTLCYTLMDRLLQPEKIVAKAAAHLDEVVPAVRQQLEAEVDRQAPDIAKIVSDQAIAAIPGLRESLEAYIVEQSETAAQQAVTEASNRLNDLLREHRGDVQSLISEIAENDTPPLETAIALDAALSQELGPQMQSNSDDVLKSLNSLNDRLDRLADGINLTPEEERERRLVMLFRRLQQSDSEGGSP